MKNKNQDIVRFMESRFNAQFSHNGKNTDYEFLNVLKKSLEEYFNTPLDIYIHNVTTEIDMIQFLRETLVIELDTLDHFVMYPTSIEIRKELRGYTLSFKIRGIDASKMLEVARLAHELIESQDSLNYEE